METSTDHTSPSNSPTVEVGRIMLLETGSALLENKEVRKIYLGEQVGTYAFETG